MNISLRKSMSCLPLNVCLLTIKTYVCSTDTYGNAYSWCCLFELKYTNIYQSEICIIIYHVS